MKRLEELDLKKQADAEFTGEKYISKFEGQWIPPEYRANVRESDTEVEMHKKLADGKRYEIDKPDLTALQKRRNQYSQSTTAFRLSLKFRLGSQVLHYLLSIKH